MASPVNGGWSEALIELGNGNDAARASLFPSTLRGGSGNDRFYVDGDPTAQTIDGGDGIDAAAADPVDVLLDVEQGATAELAGGNFADQDLDGLLPGMTAQGWVGACQSSNFITRTDALAADPSWAVADANPIGGFHLTGLLPGIYLITGQLTGTDSNYWYVTSGDGTALRVTLADGERNLEANLGWGKKGLVPLQTFLDLSGDGKKAPLEPYLDDRVVWIDADDDGVLDPGEPSVTGTPYEAGAIRLGRGTYVIRSTTLDGWLFTGAAAASGRVVYVVNQSDQSTPVLFGQRPPVFDRQLTGRLVYVPTGSHLSPDGVGVGVPNVTVYIDTNGNRYPDNGERTTVTDASGTYRFSGLAPLPSMAVNIVYNSDYRAGHGTYGTDESQYVDLYHGSPAVVSSHFPIITPNALKNVYAGQVYFNDDWDTFLDPVPPALDIRVYADLNADGIHQSGEPSATLASNGTFQLTYPNLSLSQLRLSVPNGYVGTATVSYSQLTLNVTPAVGSIGGRVVLSTSGGAVNRSDPTLSHRIVWIDLDGGGTQDANEPWTTTDERGAYAFLNPPTGSYTVRTDAAGGLQAAAKTVTNFTGATTLSSVDLSVMPVSPASGTASLSGQLTQYWTYYNDKGPILGYANQRIWVDLDGDGVRDGNEPTTVSGDNGAYLITDVPPGTYNVRVEPTSPWVQDGTSSVSFVAGKQARAWLWIKRDTWSLLDSGVSHEGPNPVVWYRFDDDVSEALAASHLTVMLPNATYQMATSLQWDAQTNTASFSLPSMPADAGDWYAYLAWWPLHGTMLRNNTNIVIKPLTVHNVTGDITGDGRVDFDDLLVLARNYGSMGRRFSQGNVDRSADGSVGFDDLLVLAKHYNTAPSPTASTAVESMGSIEAPATVRKRRDGGSALTSVVT